jgi:hypothetical protein
MAHWVTEKNLCHFASTDKDEFDWMTLHNMGLIEWHYKQWNMANDNKIQQWR